MSQKGDMILVTGGAGFIGSQLVEGLVQKKYNVRVLDVLSRGSLRYIQPLIDTGKIEYIDADIRYKDAVDKAMKGVDYVFHEAATNINRSIAYPEESFDVNFKGAQVVFKSAIDHGVKKVMFASSASVYGQPKVLPMSEDAELNPITPYCVSKVASEYLLKFYTRHGLKYVTFRYFNVYGLRQHTDAYYTSVIIIFLKRLMRGDPPIVSGTGKQAMDFVNVKDIVRANIMGMESDVGNETFNVGTGKTTSVRDLAYKIIKIYGKEVEPIFKTEKAKEELVSERRADITKAEKLLGFKAEVDIDTGLEEVAKDILKNPDRY
jgi:UDP-glucose 4-epimerase